MIPQSPTPEQACQGGLLEPPLPMMWACAWCGCWFTADGVVEAPEVVPLFPSHGICTGCLAREKKKLEAMKQNP
jgi:hypothetical protein